MVAVAPLALYNHFFIMLFTASREPHKSHFSHICRFFPLCHFVTSDLNFFTSAMVWKGLKQSTHSETLHLSHDTTLLLFLSSLDVADQRQILQQGPSASGVTG